MKLFLLFSNNSFCNCPLPSPSKNNCRQSVVLIVANHQKEKNENNTIGILLCAEKNDTVVKYTLPEKKKEIYVAKYLPYLPIEEELKNEIKKEKENLKMQLRLKGFAKI